jgi:hypothetical protein
MGEIAGEIEQSEGDRAISSAREAIAFSQPSAAGFGVFNQNAPVIRVSGSLRGDLWIVAAAALLVLVPMGIGRLLGVVGLAGAVPRWALFAAVWVPAGIVGAWLLWRKYQESMEFRSTPLNMDKNARVGVFATPAQTKRLETVRDEFFEPIVFALPFTREPSESERQRSASKPKPHTGWPTREDFLLRAAVLIVGIGVLEGVWVVFTGSWLRVNFMTILVGMMVARLPLAWVRPAYLRFVPGRVDVMRFGLFGKKPAKTQSISLRGRRVRISMWGLVFEDTDERGAAVWRSVEWCERMSWSGSLARPDIARAALMAAVSSRAAPGLPDDELVG